MWNINASQLTVDEAEAFGTLAVFTLIFIWLYFLNVLRSSFRTFSIMVSGLIEIMKNLIPFMIAVTLILFAFSELFHIDALTSSFNKCKHSPVSGNLSLSTQMTE